MGTGWRRAFCTSIRRDPEANYLDDRQAHHQQQPQNSPPPRSCVKLGIFSSSSGGSNPSTPRLQGASNSSTPRLRCRTKPSDQSKALQGGGTATTATTPPPSAPASAKASPKLLLENFSNPSSSSPRSPSAFALLKATLRLSRSRCGICAQSVRSSSGRKTAVFTAECSHAFHFPCISAHVRTQGCLSCPVCSAAWHQVPLLSSAAAATPKQAQHEETSRAPAGQHPHKRRSGGGEPPKSPHGTGNKIYDDDEPLMPSTPGGGRGGAMQLHFNPIPEEDDGDCDNGEGDEEGNGCSIPVQGRDGALEVAVKPESVALVGTGRNHYNYVVALKVKAPSLLPPRQPNSEKSPARIAAGAPPNLLDPSRRAPIDLVAVLDVSESMSKEKLQMLKKAMRLVVSSLGPADRLSIVAFAAMAAKRLLPLRRMSRQGQRAACQIVDRLVMCNDSGQSHRASSCVGSALRKATKVLEDRRERNPVATIMLFSDGHGQGQQQQQQQGEEDPRSQPSAATRFTHLEIPINASAPHHQQQQKQQMTGAVLEEEEEDAFAKCVKGLVSVVLQDVHLQLVFPSGVISSVYSYNNNNGGRGILRPVAHGEGGNSVPLGDLYAEEERELLVELRIPAAAVSVDGGCPTMSVRCSFRDPATREVIIGRDYPLVVQLPPPELQLHSPRPRLLRSSSLTSIKSTAQQQLRDQFIATRAMAESCRLVDLNDLETAVHLLSSARALLMQHQYSASVPSRQKLVLALEAELSDLQLRRSQPFSLSNSRRNEPVPAEARGGGEPLTPTSAWRAAEQLAKVAIMRKSLNRVSDLHGLEDARF